MAATSGAAGMTIPRYPQHPPFASPSDAANGCVATQPSLASPHTSPSNLHIHVHASSPPEDCRNFPSPYPMISRSPSLAAASLRAIEMYRSRSAPLDTKRTCSRMSRWIDLPSQQPRVTTRTLEPPPPLLLLPLSSLAPSLPFPLCRQHLQ